MSTLKRILSSAGVLLIWALPLYALLRPALPVDPTKAILDAFQMYQVVALGEGSHGNEQAHRFRLALIRNPRFPNVVNDIVVESGSARHQDVMDRFIRGENVPAEVLSRVWRDTTQPTEIRTSVGRSDWNFVCDSGWKIH
jgi:erythromycin esterase-like protein